MGKNIITSREEFINENYGVNEFFKFFGLGKKEKEINDKIDKAKSEIDRFDFSTLFKEPALDSKYNKRELEKLIDIALKRAGSDLKSVKELMPEPFNPAGKDSLTATYKMGSKILKGIIPSGFSFLLDRRKGNLMFSPSECKSILKEKIEKLGK